jgi:branched-chain amino acid aminotransferase
VQSTERGGIAYVNGEFVPAAEASISIFDRGLMNGDCVFDNVRTYGGRPFKVDEHLERLRKSLVYVGIEADELIAEFEQVIDELIDRNREEIEELGDVYVITMVTRGVMAPAGFMSEGGPTRIGMIKSLNLAGFGGLYETGADLTSSFLRTHFAGTVDPRVKTASRAGGVPAELKARRLRTDPDKPGSFVVMFNHDGSIGESHASNVSLVSGKRFVRPPRHQALEGVSLEILGDLAEELGFMVEERPIYLYDLVNADEVFVTGTSYGVVPVVSLDGEALNNGREVYDQLLDAWVDMAGFDFVTQAKERALGATR